jgi:hypothetical protein
MPRPFLTLSLFSCVPSFFSHPFIFAPGSHRIVVCVPCIGQTGIGQILLWDRMMAENETKQKKEHERKKDRDEQIPKKSGGK